ncbi:DUF1588 domain-containing protein [Lentisphaera profundi]|uniref:DUF1588 domain-containing protein n=1 Tax=Lentisphaera profundi TaxID=1658616 RepID=A0ABY7VXI1_9BACT|nr:DUF1592 domain-containing protein [Lentisphaera profundi]WDE98422.1 DUF1588 domain-containing protein [Lentisphaera profundi]
MSEEKQENDAIPMMSPELKEELRQKIADLEKLELAITAGEIQTENTEALLNEAMKAIEDLLERARKEEEAYLLAHETDDLKELTVLKSTPSAAVKQFSTEQVNIAENETNSLDKIDGNLKSERLAKDNSSNSKPAKPSPTKRRKMTSKKKLSVPTKRPRAKKKKSLPMGMISLVLILGAGAYFYQDIMGYVKKQQAELAEKNKPKIVLKKEIRKSKPKPQKVAPVIVEPKEELTEPENFFQPDEELLFTGELKHFSFNQVLRDKCVTCHGAEGKEAEGDFNIARLMTSKSLNQKSWAKIYRSIDKKEMPPPIEDEPDSIPLEKEEQGLLLASIKVMFEDLKEGVTTRVLTPYEIQNTLGDLFDIDHSMYNPFKALRQAYSGANFYSHQRKVLSPHYVSQYYNILYDVLQSFIGLRPQVDKMDTVTSLPGSVYAAKAFKGETHLRWPQKNPKLFTGFDIKDITERKQTKQERYLDGNENALVNEILAKRTLPPGTYKLTFKANTENMSMTNITEYKYGPEVVRLYEDFFDRNQNLSLPVHFHLEPPDYADPFAKVKFLDTMDISSEGEYGIEFTINRRTALACNMTYKMPSQQQLANLISYHKHGDKHENKTVQIEMANLGKKAYDFPMVKMWDFKIEGPYNVKLNPLSFEQDTKVNDMEVREKFKYLHTFNGMKLSVIYTYIFSGFRKEKMKYEDAYRNAMIMFFMSPKFLILNSEAKTFDDKARYLSYATQKSAPTDELIQEYKKVLKSGDTKYLGTWLIKHDRFTRFIEAFTYQWLKLGEIENNMPDQGKYREYYKQDLGPMQQQEIELFMTHMFKENLPISDLVSSEYSFLNETLANFYGTNNRDSSLASNDFHKVKVTDVNRGGIFNMGAFLTATSNGVDPLPLRRAAWISENLLDSPLPSPPDVDVNDFENKVSGRTLSERLAVHAENPACHSCHKRLDSLAILMDQYDSIGGYNSDFTAEPVKINDQKIRGLDDLKTYMGNYSKPMARAFTKKLISFMLGREPGVQDEAKLDAILLETQADNYRIGDLYAALIKQYFL